MGTRAGWREEVEPGKDGEEDRGMGQQSRGWCGRMGQEPR